MKIVKWIALHHVPGGTYYYVLNQVHETPEDAAKCGQEFLRDLKENYPGDFKRHKTYVAEIEFDSESPVDEPQPEEETSPA